MATKNVVPRANGEGELGTSSKQWKKVNAQQFTGSLGVSASFFEGDGSRLTNVGGGSSFSVTGDVNNRVITADGSSGGVGEANLTFNGSTLGVVGNIDIQGNVTGATNVYVGDKIALRNTTSADYITYALGGFYYKGSGTFLGNLSVGQFSASSGTSTFQNNVSASVNVSASGFYGESAEITTITPTYIDGGTIRDSGGSPQAAATSGEFRVLNNFVAGRNASPDVFAVDRGAGKAAVGVDIGDVSSLSSDFTVVGDVSASVNVSASAFYGKQLVQQHPGGSTYPMLSEGTATGEKQPYFDISLAYNTSMNRLYVGTIQTSTSGYYIADSNASHPTEISGKALMYAIGGEMYVKDESGNQTLISPHDEDGEWQYYSRNTRTGKVVRIRMEKMIRALEDLTGQTFIEEE